ncbi:MAG: sulfatase-like hydrolase/transferase [Thermoguttaceae bacterium]
MFIFADDQAFNTIGALGHPTLKTPHLDRLVHEGTTFTNAYNQGGWHGAVCVASRSMLNTGRFLWNAKRAVEQYKTQKDDHQEQTTMFWSQMLHDAGYETYFTGKWHVDGVPVESLFDHVGIVRAGGMPPTVESSYDRPFEHAEDVWSPFDPQFKGHWSGGRHWAEVHAESSIGMIEEAAKRDAPFFMYLAFNSPHDPRQAPKEFVELYPQEKMDVPDNFLPENPHKDVMGCPASLRDEKLATFPRIPYAVRVHRREYYAIITHMDFQIGRILDAIEKSGKRDNTYIIFSADNGLAIGSHGLFGKQNMFEHSVKIPLIIVGPNIPKCKQIATPVYLQDIMPTTLEISDQTLPTTVQFKSLLPVMRGAESLVHESIYGAYMMQQRMVRKGDFKLVIYPDANVRLLFDLKNDPSEITNLADKPEYAAKMRELLDELNKLQKETGDTIALSH